MTFTTGQRICLAVAVVFLVLVATEACWYQYSERKPLDDKKTQKFIDQMIKAHNKYRKKHGVEALVENKNLSAIAQRKAKTINELDVRYGFFNNPAPMYNGHRLGQNIAVYYGDDRPNGKYFTNLWYSEIKDYEFKRRTPTDFGIQTQHFTQMVWRSSREIGIGILKDNGTCARCCKSFYVVAVYNPAGNKGLYNGDVFERQD